jgi:hypothetical protein
MEEESLDVRLTGELEITGGGSTNDGIPKVLSMAAADTASVFL